MSKSDSDKHAVNIDVSNYRDTSVVYDEIRQVFHEFCRNRSPVVIWQKNNIKSGRIKTIDKKDNIITILGINNDKLHFSDSDSIFFYNEEHSVFGKSKIISADQEANTVSMAFPSMGKVKLAENRKSGRIATLDRYISISLKKELFPTPVSALYLVNISSGGMAVRVTNESSNIFHSNEVVEWSKFSGGSFKSPLKVTICHVSKHVHLPNLGDNNTVIGIEFNQPIPQREYVKLLEKLFYDRSK
ncbi:MAG: hypothetical protein HN730_00365 [Bdellovibrionales bacterium]|nr:hypothetical protein [Bdellovibrionales bacterium]